MLAVQGDKVLAGTLCYVTNDTCFAVESGVLEADPQLFQQGINTLLLWYVAVWGQSQGAKVFDMGGSHAWHSHGSFTFKRRWGAKVTRRRRIFPTWIFLAQHLSPELQAQINKLGFISEIDNKFYTILLEDKPICLELPERQYNTSEMAQELGLAGWALISPNNKPVIHEQ
jgi:hypothetical protein